MNSENMVFSDSDPNIPRTRSAETKNNNTIKKIGRLFLDNLAFFKGGASNPGIIEMNRRLDERAYSNRNGKKRVNKRDLCNLHIIMGLIQCEDDEVNSSNLRSIQTILKGKLRKDVIDKSDQIKGDKKIVYLNTLKCSSLRSIHSNLFKRLQQGKIV